MSEYQYGVKLLRDDELIMSLPTDDQGFVDYAPSLMEGEGYGRDYIVVRREVGKWEEVNELQ